MQVFYGENFMNNEKNLFSIGEIAKTIGITQNKLLYKKVLTNKPK